MYIMLKDSLEAGKKNNLEMITCFQITELLLEFMPNWIEKVGYFHKIELPKQELNFLLWRKCRVILTETKKVASNLGFEYF